MLSILAIVGVPLVGVFAVGTISSAIKRRRAARESEIPGDEDIIEEDPVKTKKMTREKAIAKLEAQLKTLEKENEKSVRAIFNKVNGMSLEDQVVLLADGALKTKWNQMSNAHRAIIERRIEEIKRAPKNSDFEKMSSVGELSLNRFLESQQFAKIVESIKEKYPAYQDFAKIELGGRSMEDPIFKQFGAYAADLRSQLVDPDVKVKAFQRDAYSKKTTLLQAMSTSSKVESMGETLTSLKDDVKGLKLDVAKLMTDVTGLELDAKEYREKLSIILPKLKSLEAEFIANKDKTIETLSEHYEMIRELDKALYVIESRFGDQMSSLTSSIQKQLDSMKEKITDEFKERIFEVEKRIDREVENLSLTSASEIEECHRMIVDLDRALYGLEESFDKRLGIMGRNLRSQLRNAEARIIAGYEKKIAEAEARFDEVIATKVVSKDDLAKYKKSVEEALKSNLDFSEKTLKSMLKRLEALDKKLEKMKTANASMKKEIKSLKAKVARRLTKREVIQLARQEAEAREQKNSARIKTLEEKMEELASRLTASDIIDLLNERVEKLETEWSSDRGYIDTRIEAAKNELREFLKRSLAQRVGARLDEKLKSYFKDHKDELSELVGEVVSGMKVDVDVEDDELIETIVTKIGEKYTMGFSRK